MIFLLGLQQMTRQEKITLLAQIITLTGFNLLNEGIQKTAKNAKRTVLTGVKTVLEKAGAKDPADKVNDFNQKTDWDTNIIKANIDKTLEKLETLTEQEIDFTLRWYMLDIGDLKPPVTDEELCNSIIAKAAKAYGTDIKKHLDFSAMENWIFEKAVEEQFNILKTSLSKMDIDEQEKYETLLNEELNKLSEADIEAMKRATGLEKLTAKSVHNFLRTTSSVVLTQLIVGGFGFGAYLFLATSIKALSLLLGVTFAFGTYTAASSILAFLLSGPFILLISALTGGFIYFQTTRKVDELIAKMFILAGKGNLIKLSGG